MSDKELSGRVAVITGAGRSIGRAMAIELASAGCAVVVNVRSNKAEADEVVKEIEKAGGKAIAAIADVTDAPAVQKMAAAALKQFGRIDYLINNAALRQEKHIEQMTFEDWRRIIARVQTAPRPLYAFCADGQASLLLALCASGKFGSAGEVFARMAAWGAPLFEPRLRDLAQNWFAAQGLVLGEVVNQIKDRTVQNVMTGPDRLVAERLDQVRLAHAGRS